MRYQKIAIPMSAFFLVILIWHLLVTVLNINPILFPTPFKVFMALFDSGNLLGDIYASVIRLIIGSVIGIAVGIFFGLLTGRSYLFNESFGKISNFLRFIPPLALVPLFLVWFGIGEMSKISLLAWTCFFPVWISTHNGVKNIERNYLLVAKSLEVKKAFLIKNILIKGAMPYILNGIRIGVGFAFSVLVAAEMIGAYKGIGYRISFLQSVYRVDKMLVYIILLGIIGIIADRLVIMVSRRLTPWKNVAEN